MAVALAVLSLGLTSSSRAGLIFDDSANYGNTTRYANSELVTYISDVAQNTTITNIGMLDGLATAGHIKFLIYNITTSNLDYISAPVSFAADLNGDSWKVSNSFTFTLLAGDQYYIGGVADVQNTAAFQYPPPNVTQNGITASSGANFDSNGNYVGTYAGGVPLRLYSNPVATVPEPPTLVSGGMAVLIGAVWAWRKRRRAAS